MAIAKTAKFTFATPKAFSKKRKRATKRRKCAKTAAAVLLLVRQNPPNPCPAPMIWSVRAKRAAFCAIAATTAMSPSKRAPIWAKITFAAPSPARASVFKPNARLARRRAKTTAAMCRVAKTAKKSRFRAKRFTPTPITSAVTNTTAYPIAAKSTRRIKTATATRSPTSSKAAS